MITTRKTLFAALCALAVAFGSAHAMDEAIRLSMPETDYGRVDVWDLPMPEGPGAYGDRSPAEAHVLSMPETDYGRVDVWDQPSRAMGPGVVDSYQDAMPVNSGYHYSENH